MSVIALRGAVLADADRPPIEDGVVLVKDEWISAIGAWDEVRVPRATELLDARGLTLMPGLVDAHVHLTPLTYDEWLRGLDPPLVARSVLRGAAHAAAALRHGVTTVRDCGAAHHGIFELREAIVAGTLPGPRLVLAGAALATTGGHAPMLSVQADGDAGVRAAVRAQVAAGADLIKIMATGGTATPGERTLDVQFTREELAAIVDETHRRGKRVAAHCSCQAGAELLVEVGVDTIEHGIELDDAVCAAMAQAGIFLITTTALTRYEAESGDPAIAPFTRAKAGPACESQFASLRRALTHGVPIALGTDADGMVYPFGETLASELEWVVRAGGRPRDALRAATLGGARACAVDHEVGTLEPGKVADVIGVAGDPLRDVGAVACVQLVMARGRVAHDGRGQSATEAAAV